MGPGSICTLAWPDRRGQLPPRVLKPRLSAAQPAIVTAVYGGLWQGMAGYGGLLRAMAGYGLGYHGHHGLHGTYLSSKRMFLFILFNILTYFKHFVEPEGLVQSARDEGLDTRESRSQGSLFIFES